MLYLIVNLLVLLPPLALSFDKKVHFVSLWRSFWPANLLVLAGFVAWDVAFTEMGVWGFNEAYLIGVDIAGLPLEEWLFFVTVPYSCTFTYATLRAYIRRDVMLNVSQALTFVAWVTCVWLTVAYSGHLYTQWAAGLTAVWLTWALVFTPAWIGRLWLAYLVLLVPFVASNGVLTGITFWEYPFLHAGADQISDQIVWYSPLHNTGWRMFSMPVDDLVYGFLLIALNIGLMERLERRHQRKAALTAR